MKKISLALLVSSSLLAPLSAVAVQPGFYFGGGYTDASVDFDGLSNDADLGLLFVRGGYQFNEYAALEARLGTGVEDDKIYGVKVEAEDVYGGYLKLGTPTQVGLYPYVLLGFTHAELKANGYSDSDTDMSYGVGADYWFNPSVSAGLEYARLYDENGVEVNGLTLGLNFKY